MMQVLFIAVTLLLCSGSAVALQQLSLNPKSTISQDVESVVHVPEDRRIDIKLNASRRCSSPMFRVRLSGAALFLAELSSHSETTYTYKYPCIIDPGTYFIEVITLFCTEFNPSSYTGICLESVFDGGNIVILPSSFQMESDPACGTRPRWKLGTNGTGAPYEPLFLPTRHQLKLSEVSETLPCDTGIVEGFCNPSNNDIEEFSRYQWVDAPDWRKFVEPLVASALNPALPNIHICYVGDSHSGELVRFGKMLTKDVPGVTHTFILAVLPSLFSTSSLAAYKCSIAIISFGQWVFGNNAKPAITKEKYVSEIRKVVAQGGVTKHSGPTKVFFRTENFNGLGARYTSCPPLDYRSVPAIHMLNEAVRELSAELDLAHIDLTHIQAVHWDGAPDYNHPGHNVVDAEINWILFHVLSHLHHQQANITTYAVNDEANVPKLMLPQYKKQLQDALGALALPP